MNALAGLDLPRRAPPLPPVSDETTLAWTERNQRWLVSAFRALRSRIESWDATGASRPQPLRLADGDVARSDFVSALDRCAALFALSPFERDLLLLAAGLELDRELRAALLAFAPGGLTFTLAMGLLDQPHWSALSPQAPLRHWQLLRLQPGRLPTQAVLAVDERILHFISGVAACDERLSGIARFAGDPQAADATAAERIEQFLLQPDLAGTLLLIEGGSPEERRDSAVAGVLRSLWRPLLVSVDDLGGSPAFREELARLLDREAALGNGAIVMWSAAARSDTPEQHRATAAFIDLLRSPVVVAAAIDRDHLRPCRRRLAAVQLDPTARIGTLLSGRSETLDEAVRIALLQFQVGPRLLQECLETVTGSDPDPGATLWRGLRRAARGGLDALAQRIETTTIFDDLVLPAAQAGQLRDIAAQLQHRHVVYQDWGFAGRGARGMGIAALFAGESGTGKTLAAEAIANEAGLDLYRIDLASTVSKYIGETEKNLRRVFDAAESSGAVLLFDEADALFGKRSEVRDSHDRYANIETAYLLQRIEAYRGLAVLTTNMKSALDRAFLRRLRFVVQFPFPDEAARAELWRRQFPPAAPLDPVDFASLARLQLAGGHIRSIALNAAFAAAARRQPITQQVLVEAARAELAKLDRLNHGPGQWREA